MPNPYRDDRIRIEPTRTEHAVALEELQRLVFPTLADSQRFKAAHYRRHLEIFPEGQLVAIADDHVVGATTTLRLDVEVEVGPENSHRTFDDVIAGGWLTTHAPRGRWLYGADIGVDPRYRGRGVARALYAARQRVVRDLDLAGQVTVGMLSGYGAVRDIATLTDYHADVISGRRRDPTVSFQIAIGFEPRGLVRGYLDDPSCGGAGVLLVLPAARDVSTAP